MVRKYRVDVIEGIFIVLSFLYGLLNFRIRDPAYDWPSPDGKYVIEAYRGISFTSFFGGFGQGGDAEGYGQLRRVGSWKVLHTFKVPLLWMLRDAVLEDGTVYVDGPDGWDSYKLPE